MIKPIRLPLMLATMLVITGCNLQTTPRATETRALNTMHIPNAPLVVETRNGSVEIVASPGSGDVVIAATITCTGSTDEEAMQRLADTVISIARDTSRALVIRPEFAGDTPRSGDGARLTIRIPDARDVHIRTSNGSVRLGGMSGPLDVATSNGRVTVTDHDGPAVVHTSNGSVTISGLGGPADVESSNGAVQLSLLPDVAGPVLLRTSNGSIALTVGEAFHGAVSLRTSNGRVVVDGLAGRVAQQDLSRSSGRLVIGKGGEASDLRTSNGGIRVTVK